MTKIRIESYLLAIIGAFLVFVSGCSEDFFNEKAGDRITPDKHYRTSIDFEISAYGALLPLQDVMPKFIILDGLRSDIMDVTPYADAHLNEINEHIISEVNPFTNPADFYKVIININELLANIDKIAERDRFFDEYVTYFAKGALISMRAWVYFTLVRLYGEAAYIEDNMTSLPGVFIDTTDMLDKDVMIDTLINQLTPYIYEDYPSDVQYAELKLPYYVNTKALLGEMYLEINDYVNAVLYLKLACESYLNQNSLLKVDATYRDLAWGGIHLNAESQELENLSVIPYNSSEGQYNQLANWTYYQYKVKPTQILIDSFNSQPAADGTVGDPYRSMFTVYEDTLSGNAVITKYILDEQDPFSSDIIISRAADIHLLLAEAYNRIGTVEAQYYALMLLNQGANAENPKPAEYAKWSRNIGIRGRVYLASREVPEGLGGEGLTLLIEDYIMAERAMELAYEGKRWFDLVRVAERRGKPEYLADIVAEKFKGTPKYVEVRTRMLDKENWYLSY